jgi:myo-inositol-1(or 4)-monophosphatase
MDLDEGLGIAVSAARQAAGVHRRYLGRVPADDWAEKGVHDFVTAVDREAEATIIGCLLDAFPDHRFLAEEQATSPLAEPAGRFVRDPRTPGWTWVIDPLDGTTNYLHRYPMYSVSIAALRDGEPQIGVVMHGATGETWTAIRDRGAFRDGTRIEVSGTNRLEHALIGTGFPFKALDRMPEYLGQFDRVIRRCAGIRRAGSAALDLCHLASGYFDGFWELVLAPWDIAAGILIVREAGGRVTDLDGNADVIRGGSVLAGNPFVHAALASILTGEDR